MFKKFDEFLNENENISDDFYFDVFEEIKPSPYAALTQAESKMREKIQEIKLKIEARDKPEQIPLMTAQHQLMIAQLKVLGWKKAVLAQKSRLESNK